VQDDDSGWVAMLFIDARADAGGLSATPQSG